MLGLNKEVIVIHITSVISNETSMSNFHSLEYLNFITQRFNMFKI